MGAIVNAERIFNVCLASPNVIERTPFLGKPEKVSGVWDTVISTVLPRNEVTGDRNLRFLPQSLEKLLGEFAYPGLVARNGGLSFNTEKKLLVDKVKNQLLPFVRREFDWDIRLVSSKEMNACALPGGKIIICEGIIDTMIDYLRSHMDEIQAGLSRCSEQEQAAVLGRELESMLAAVIGHEIAHSDIGHGRSAVQRAVIFYLLIFIGFILTYFFSQKPKKEEEKKESQVVTNLKVGAGFVNSYLFDISYTLYNLAQSRGAEYEADAMGMQVYMHDAGYDLNGAVRVMDMFVKKKVSCHSHVGLIEKVTEFFSTHPLSEKRREQAIEIRDRVQSL